ncbi:MAG: DJ-1/PfpI family protein [Bacilli bacterium]
MEKKKILFLCLNNYAEWEASYLASAINELSNKFEVKVVSITKEPIKTIGGFTTLPDYDIINIIDNYEALFLIGGYSWVLKEAKKVVPLIEKTIKENKLLGAICAASEFLAANGYLNKIKHTSNGLVSCEGWENTLYNNSANYIDAPAVIDQNIITANGTAALEFARLSLLELKVNTKEKIEEWYEFNKLGLCGFVSKYNL